jgi:predicted aspartyl protease|tara:strand:- start:221 stop:376 length:156 start_codon:yes stop_codon:yes gene_type:complete
LNTKLTLSSRGNSINNKTIDTGFSAGDYLLVRRHNTPKGIKDIAEEVSSIF